MVEVQEVEQQEVHYQDTVETIVVEVVEPTVEVAVVVPTHKMVVEKYKVVKVVAVSSL
jgi:hypothetical protein